MNSPSRLETIRKMPKEQVLLSLLKKQRKYYEAILELSREEALLLSEGKAGKHLLASAKQKQVLFSCIEEIENALNPINQWWQNSADRDTPLAKEVIKELTELDLLLQTLMKLDEINQKNLKKIISNLEKQTPLKT